MGQRLNLYSSKKNFKYLENSQYAIYSGKGFYNPVIDYKLRTSLIQYASINNIYLNNIYICQSETKLQVSFNISQKKDFLYKLWKLRSSIFFFKQKLRKKYYKRNKIKQIRVFKGLAYVFLLEKRYLIYHKILNKYKAAENSNILLRIQRLIALAENPRKIKKEGNKNFRVRVKKPSQTFLNKLRFNVTKKTINTFYRKKYNNSTFYVKENLLFKKRLILNFTLNNKEVSPIFKLFYTLKLSNLLKFKKIKSKILTYFNLFVFKNKNKNKIKKIVVKKYKRRFKYNKYATPKKVKKKILNTKRKFFNKILKLYFLFALYNKNFNLITFYKLFKNFILKKHISLFRLYTLNNIFNFSNFHNIVNTPKKIKTRFVFEACHKNIILFNNTYKYNLSNNYKYNKFKNFKVKKFFNFKSIKFLKYISQIKKKQKQYKFKLTKKCFKYLKKTKLFKYKYLYLFSIKKYSQYHNLKLKIKTKKVLKKYKLNFFFNKILKLNQNSTNKLFINKNLQYYYNSPLNENKKTLKRFRFLNNFKFKYTSNLELKPYYEIYNSYQIFNCKYYKLRKHFKSSYAFEDFIVFNSTHIPQRSRLFEYYTFVKRYISTYNKTKYISKKQNKFFNLKLNQFISTFLYTIVADKKLDFLINNPKFNFLKFSLHVKKFKFLCNILKVKYHYYLIKLYNNYIKKTTQSNFKTKIKTLICTKNNFLIDNFSSIKKDSIFYKSLKQFQLFNKKKFKQFKSEYITNFRNQLYLYPSMIKHFELKQINDELMTSQMYKELILKRLHFKRRFKIKRFKSRFLRTLRKKLKKKQKKIKILKLLKLNQKNLSFFDCTRFTIKKRNQLKFKLKKFYTTKINYNSLLLIKLSHVLTNFLKKKHIQIYIYNNVYTLLKKFKKNLFIVKAYNYFNTLKNMEFIFKVKRINFMKLKNLYFKILKQPYYTKKFFKNNELFLCIINCLFKRLSTTYFLQYLCKLFKKIKSHKIFLSQVFKLLAYFFKEYSKKLPVKGLKFIIRGRINAKPRKQQKIIIFGTMGLQRFNTKWDQTQQTAYTKQGTFGLTLIRNSTTAELTNKQSKKFRPNSKRVEKKKKKNEIYK